MINEVWRKQVECGAIWQPARVQDMDTNLHFDEDERLRLRDLASQVAEIAARDDMKEKIARWTAHNDLRSTAPVVYVDPENGWNEIFTDDRMQCRDPLARSWEFRLLKRIFSANVVKDDTVITRNFDVPFIYDQESWGIEPLRTGGGNGHAYHMESALKDYEKDLPRIRFPKIVINYELTERVHDLAISLFGDILNVRRFQKWHQDDSYVSEVVVLRGLEEFMCDFIADPEGLTAFMELCTNGMLERFDWMEENHLFFLNNENVYVGTGGLGFCSDLPAPDFSGTVRTKDLWCMIQAQETVSVNPEQYAEYILPFQKKIAERFGHVCYGCCEPVDPRWECVKTIPNLRKVSVSPWAKWERMPELLGKNYIASIKPNPSRLAFADMNEEVVRADCRRAVEATYGCICQFIMKDNHTLGNNPNNLVRWTQIMREEIARKY